ncbi:efflux RND transporter periplasmic adaptor subunit [Chelatococcus reniformis]|uniref:MexE family multidrug efflux RND transporter periplasmic adaptor subunit n=1 Tax=Chelatococcus reniformis TaxID=1494448 RepID=A0A916U5Y3_9HYPH|nr:efflux RND transporter periplasmic adaptor subunit [Chelatococcus reniformis]GGC59943.1 MexE family multidrug efflux RND transporter periplasmic adaptor subunit [Chelatococcus reniformis]
MSSRLIAVLLIAAAAVGAGYYWLRSSAHPPPAQASVALPPPEVNVLTAQAEVVPLTTVYAGRVAGFRDVEIRAQVGGFLLKREFVEGAPVKQGQVLFQIDPKPYQAALDRANAQVAQAQAALRQTADTLRRNEELLRRQVASDKQRDDALAARDQAQASVQLAQAEADTAKLNLGYTTIRSPVSGNTRLVSPPEGTLVQAQQTLLTTVTVLDPAYVNFSFTDAEFQAFQTLNARLAKPITSNDVSVELRFGDGTVYPRAGRLDVSASLVSEETGTIRARAIFANPDGRLLPGQFVRVAVKGVALPGAIAIPKQAVSQGPQGPFVYVVDDGGNAVPQPVKLANDLGERWVVEDGLKPGDRVIVDGIMRVRPGNPVKAVALDAPRQAAAGPAAERAADRGTAKAPSATDAR